MKQRFEVTDYAELKREVEALRKKIEDMESGEVRLDISARATRWSLLSRKSSMALTTVIFVMLLAGLGLGAQDKLSALFIDQKGRVGINTTKPEKTLDVNGDAVFHQPVTVDGLTVTNDAIFGKQLRAAKDGTLDMVGPTTMAGTTTMNGGLRLGNSDMYFTNTDHKHTAIGNTVGWAAFENATTPFNALMILGRMVEVGAKKDKFRDISMWDRIAIGKSNPQAPLDVKGEIRGKPWVSQEYEWKQGQNPVQMTRVDRTVCFLTLVSGVFYGWGEYVQVTPGSTYWMLSGGSGQKDVRAKARCIGVPDDEVW